MANVLLLFEDLMAKIILNVNMTILFKVAKILNKTSDILFIAQYDMQLFHEAKAPTPCVL